ncbi:hypothetical protein Ccrd_007886 [Cynara cardunculus var. scolymus]|uniref:Uncharacterized protein n=1 Tax=Cynara cardunculus var. scolymus TaxID=59895 RepID=A0A118JTK6_CYNCS|nr:hypothetical protein Ccrd_007886 [Cynara cardunculus var. scolymus]
MDPRTKESRRFTFDTMETTADADRCVVQCWKKCCCKQIYTNLKARKHAKEIKRKKRKPNQGKLLNASKNNGAISGFGVLMAHLSPGTPMTAVSSIKKGIPRGILADRYKTSWLAFLRLAIKNMFEGANCSMVASTLFITMPGMSLETSLESGNDFHVCNHRCKLQTECWHYKFVVN